MIQQLVMGKDTNRDMSVHVMEMDFTDRFLAQLGAIRFHIIFSMGFGSPPCGLKNKSGPQNDGNDCIKGIPGGLLVIPQAVKKRGNLVHHVLSGQNCENL